MKAEAVTIAQHCYQCAICSGTCPKAKVRKGFLPRRIVYNVITGNAARAIASGEAWHCLTCKKCVVRCPFGIDFPEIVRELRKEMLGRGISGLIAHDNTIGTSLYNIMKNENLKPKKKQFLATDVKINDASDVLYFMGCITFFDAVFSTDVGSEGMEVANNAIRLLNMAGIEPAVSDEEKCCAHDQLWRGEEELFKEFGRQNAEMLRKYKTIVTGCPECYRTLAIDYKKIGINLNVKHLSEVLIEHKDKLESNGRAGIVTYHDSCRLGRHMNVYEAPRELLRHAGYEIREMQNNRSDALCCGVPQFLNCDDENKEIRRRKLNEAVATGAEIMVAPCIKCQIHLKCLQRDKSEKDAGRSYSINILDLSTVLINGLKKEVQA